MKLKKPAAERFRGISLLLRLSTGFGAIASQREWFTRGPGFVLISRIRKFMGRI